MELDRGFGVVRKYKWIWLLPTLLSLAGLLLGLLFSFVPIVKPGVHLKFTVPTGMPDVDSILKLEQTDIGALQPPLLLLTLISIIVNAFFSGGWLAMVFAALRGEEAAQINFWGRSRYFFGRLFAARVLTVLVGIFGLLFLALLLGPLALLLLVLVPLAIAYTFFWELAIVCENLSVGEGFTRGYQVMRANVGEVLQVALPIALFSAVASLIANLVAQHIYGYILLIPIWAFVGSVFSVAICALYQRLALSSPMPPINEQP